jgi:predicted DNA-binding transcriptional regulator AlpA
MAIKSKKQFAAQTNMSVRHLERLIACGEGPAVVRLGKRKRGIEEGDGDDWVKSRTVLPPGCVTVPR